MKCCKTETPGALRIVNSSGGRDRELRDVPKAMHSAEQLPRLNPSRAVPRRYCGMSQGYHVNKSGS